MRTLHLLEFASGSLRDCTIELAADPDLRIRRAAPSVLLATLAANPTDLVLLDPGPAGPDELLTGGHPPPSGLDRVVVLVGTALGAPPAARWSQAGVAAVLPHGIDAHTLASTLARAGARLEANPGHPLVSEPSATPDHRAGFHRLLSRNALFLRVLDAARSCADHDAPVLIWGEPGTGKTTLAESIHQASHRASRAFVKATATELERLLFGANQAADRDSYDQRGLGSRLESANGGTIKISGIEELTTPGQARLLRRLQRPRPGVGGPARDLDLRVIATMRRSLSVCVRRGSYRGDLYHHLGCAVLHVPALRDRREDIELLALNALRTCSTSRTVEHISSEAMRHLRAYDYPCNVSELETIIELAQRVESSPSLSEAALPSHVRHAVAIAPPEERTHAWRTLEEVEVDYTRQVLEHTGGNRSEAARIMGVSRTGLLCKIRRFGINLPPRDDA